MEELRAKGAVTARSKWQELYPVISEAPVYAAMLETGGSASLDLFKFLVDDLRAAERKAEDHLIRLYQVGYAEGPQIAVRADSLYVSTLVVGTR